MMLPVAIPARKPDVLVDLHDRRAFGGVRTDVEDLRGPSPEQRRANLHLIAYNTRFLILPSVRLRQLGQPRAGAGGASAQRGLGATLRPSDLSGGDLY